MSGIQFLDVLRGVGYTAAGDIDGRSYDWMFEDRVLSPFLEWFCDYVQESNVINPKDFREFQRLKREEGGILDGRQLEEALQNITILQDSELSEDKLREEINELEEELRSKKFRKDTLLQQRNKLSIHHTEINGRLSKLGRVKTQMCTAYKMGLEQSHADNSKMNTCLSNLTSAVMELTSLYQSSTTSSTPLEKSVFISQLNLDDYYKAEEKFTQQLHAYTKKQFFEGIANMAGDGTGSRYEFLEASNPVDLLVRGEKEDVNLDDCKGLARLQAIYPKSECQRINSLNEERSIQAACQYAEEKLRHLKHKTYPKDIQELSNKLQDSQNNLSVLRRDIDMLTEKELPALIKDSSTQQVTKILRGNYDLKIARQDYFISNQDQLIKQLVFQRARNEFLTMAYEIESKGHRDIHRLLTSATMLLQTNLTGYQDRAEMLEDPILSSKRHNRGTIDSRDKSTSRLYRLLDTENESERNQLFLTYTGLTDNSENLNSRFSSLRSSLASVNSIHDEKLSVLESNLEACESVVYSGSAVTGGQPSLSPQPIVDTLTQLDAILKKLEQVVMDVIKDVEHKKRVIKTDPSLQTTERELFIYFLTDPGKLRRAIENISSRLDAQLVN